MGDAKSIVKQGQKEQRLLMKFQHFKIIFLKNESARCPYVYEILLECEKSYREMQLIMVEDSTFEMLCHMQYS